MTKIDNPSVGFPCLTASALLHSAVAAQMFESIAASVLERVLGQCKSTCLCVLPWRVAEPQPPRCQMWKALTRRRSRWPSGKAM